MGRAKEEKERSGPDFKERKVRPAIISPSAPIFQGNNRTMKNPQQSDEFPKGGIIRLKVWGINTWRIAWE